MSDALAGPKVVSAVCANGVAGVVVFSLLPILVGKISDTFQLNDVETGLIASSYFLVYAVLAFLTLFWIRRLNWHRMSYLGYLIMSIGFILPLAFPSFESIIISMMMLGTGASIIYPISIVIVSDMSHKDRIYALKLGAEQLIPAALLLILSTSYFAGFGLKTTLITIGTVVIICAMLAFGIPPFGHKNQSAVSKSRSPLLTGIAGLFALALYFMGFAGIWTFLERTASENHIDAAITNQLLALGLIGSGIGPLIAAAIEDKYGRVYPIAFATITTVLSLLLLIGDLTPWRYGIVLGIMPMVYYFGISYFFGIIADADSNGRLSTLMSFALACGAIVGPALFGLMKTIIGNLTAYGTMAISIIIGGATIIWVQRNLQRIPS